jgi:hypothetical protein
MTLVAGSRNAEKALLKAHLAPAATGRTGLRCGSRFRAVAVASLAWTLPGYLDLLFGAGDGFLKSQVEVVTKIFSTSSTSTAACAAKELTEDIAENIFESRSEIKSAAKRTAITERRVTELIILGALL